MMQAKHVRIRVEQCLALASASNCPRRKFGAMLIDPVRNVVLADGYNGGPRAGGRLCGGEACDRDRLEVASGTRVEVGCHHAEMNVVCNAAAGGISSAGAWLVVTGEPCLLCAKLVHHAGIVRVLVVGGGYAGENGVAYLRAHGVGVVSVDGPRDPRLASAGASAVEEKFPDRMEFDPGDSREDRGDSSYVNGWNDALEAAKKAAGRLA